MNFNGIYSKPFLTRWPFPCSFSDLRQCFGADKAKKKEDGKKQTIVARENKKEEDALSVFFRFFASPA